MTWVSYFQLVLVCRLPVHVAAEEGQLQCLKAILSLADDHEMIGRENERGETALQLAEKTAQEKVCKYVCCGRVGCVSAW